MREIGEKYIREGAARQWVLCPNCKKEREARYRVGNLSKRLCKDCLIAYNKKNFKINPYIQERNNADH